MGNRVSKVVDELMTVPEKAVKHFDLIYVDNSKLTIRRNGTSSNFNYHIGNKPLDNESHLKRIQGLVIPPAWKEVKITHLANGHLQATGRDAKKRKQYRYHQLWSKIRNETKFYRMADFGEHLSSLRKKVASDLEQNGWSQTKTVALVLKLMDETHMRIGNFQYAAKNETYGLATHLKKHHVRDENKLRFEYKGKRGKEHRVTIRSKNLKRLIRQCEEIPGWELFQFFDEEGNKRKIDSEMVNDYIFEATQQNFTAKDFRTWSASVIFYESLSQDYTKGLDDDEKKPLVLKAYDQAAKALGNTRNVCRKYYVHPQILNEFDMGFNSLKNFSEEDYKKYTNLTTAEKEVLFQIKKYKPQIT